MTNEKDFPESLTEHEAKLLCNVLKSLYKEMDELKRNKLTKAMYANSPHKQVALLKNAEGLATAASMICERIESLEYRAFAIPK